MRIAWKVLALLWVTVAGFEALVLEDRTHGRIDLLLALAFYGMSELERWRR